MPKPLTTSALANNAGTRRIKVLIPLPLAGPYDYRAPVDLKIPLGSFVYVPLGTRTALGVVWSDEGSGEVDESRLKDIESLAEAPPLPDSVRRFVDWVAEYTLSPPGSVLRMAMSTPQALTPPKPRIAFALVTDPPEFRMTAARNRVLEVLADGPPRMAAELAREAGVGTGVVRGLADGGVLDRVMLPAGGRFPKPDPDQSGPTLSSGQAVAAEELVARVRAGEFAVSLLDGVTGSGKTEVYFEAMAECLRQGRQALVMLPEIALGAQWLARFEERFGERPTEWHSDLSQADRRRNWRGIAESKVEVVVGARSALFLPFDRLGLIVVDEEHDGSFKQSDGVAYNARDMAVVRARLENCAAVLASATPSLESLVNVDRSRYQHLRLPERHAGAELPAVEMIDLRREPPPRQNWLSPPLRDALIANLAAKEQSLLFLNRRGYAPLTLCRACGHRLQCPNCTAWLVEHRFAGRLDCHHCGFTMRVSEKCIECGAEGTMAACGPGVERLLEEVVTLLPEATVGLMTSDTIRGPGSAADLVAQVHAQEIDVLVGTQLVAKGHHFPMLTLVGVVDADLGLNGGDLRAAERTYQLLHQVGGRAGRAERPGRVLLQTYQPEHPVMCALAKSDRENFVAEETQLREAGVWPPFGRLAAIILSSHRSDQVEAAARDLARAAPEDSAIRVLGPAPAPLAMLRGRHRWRLLVKTTRSVRIQEVLRAWLAEVKIPNTVRLRVDIDPYSFL
ncbi:MAG: primosomal protein N' [Rhodospirillaceae bacterium]|nr:primosomal protein N' [Rhodospirillaceae bacterium]